MMADVKGIPAALPTPSVSPLPDYKHGLVIKVVEFTGCSLNEAKAALFDASNDADAAISYMFLNKPQSCRSSSSNLTTIENKKTVLNKQLSSHIIEQAALKNEIKRENQLDSADEDVQILYHSPPKVPKNRASRSPLSADAPSKSFVSSSATLSQLPNANPQPSVLPPKNTQETYRDEFMLDRIIQDYFRQTDNALSLPNYFCPDWNRDYRAQSPKNGLKRGGRPYFQPIGCMRYSVKVIGKYLPNDEWLGLKGQTSDKEWPVAYHGTKDVNVLDILVKGFLLEKGQRFAFGKGIYCSPDPRTALAYSNNYDFQGKKFQLILQCRVDPEQLQIVSNGHVRGHGEYWLIPDAAAIRPYAICVFDEQGIIKLQQSIPFSVTANAIRNATLANFSVGLQGSTQVQLQQLQLNQQLLQRQLQKTQLQIQQLQRAGTMAPPSNPAQQLLDLSQGPPFQQLQNISRKMLSGRSFANSARPQHAVRSSLHHPNFSWIGRHSQRFPCSNTTREAQVLINSVSVNLSTPPTRTSERQARIRKADGGTSEQRLNKK